VQREDTVFRALADASRRAIFERLTRGEAAVKDLTARFDISQPAVSQHLATLRSAGLVSKHCSRRWMNERQSRASISMEFDLPHPPAKVWRALTEPELLVAHGQ
jgi:DNA-binding transcriptional ArsR family regulator